MPDLPSLVGSGQLDQAAFTLPLIGRLDGSTVSPTLFTIILAALDSVNPVAFFVLSFLLGLLINENSKKRVLLVGATFVSFSAAIYFLFIAAWLNVFLLVGHLRIITIAAGMAGVVVGAINVKGYVLGGDDSPSDRPADGIMARITRLAHSRRTFSMVAGAALMAIVVNSYEMVSSLGFPLVFTRGLTLFGLSRLDYYFYLLLYCAVYVLPLAIIVLFFAFKLDANRLDGNRMKFLNLTSGMMMFFLGVVLLVKPDVLNNAFSAAGLLAGAVAAAAIVVFITSNASQSSSG